MEMIRKCSVSQVITVKGAGFPQVILPTEPPTSQSFMVSFIGIKQESNKQLTLGQHTCEMYVNMVNTFLITYIHLIHV